MSALLDCRSTTAAPREAHAAEKIDIKLAYWHCHLHSAMAVQTIAQLPKDDICILMLWLTFGRTPCPFKWNIFSESKPDLADAILHNNNWDPATLHAKCQHQVPPLHLLNGAIPFAAGLEQVVHIPINPRGTRDIYIDNFIQGTVYLDNTDNSFWCKCATQLAIDCCSRPKQPHEPIPWEYMEARNKLSAKAGLEGEKIILGWKLDTRRLIVFLPTNKFFLWTKIINLTLETSNTRAKELESIIGRLGHLGLALPTIYHFLSHLQDLQFRARHRWKIPLMA
jgi:hypothetical protein